jgi:hypothetical protein
MRLEREIPVPRDLPAARLQRRKEHLVREVAASIGRGERRRKRWLLGALVPAAVLLLGATGIGMYVLTREATHLESIACYATADLGADTTIVSAGGRDPVAVCAELWQDGVVGPGQAPARLAACVLESGAVGVFPATGPDTCNSLGLAKLAEGFAINAGRVADLSGAVTARLAIDCVGEREARELVGAELAARDFGAWRVQVAGDGYSGSRPCTQFGTDASGRLALLIPVEAVQIGCYEEAKLPADLVFVRANGIDPVALCARLWRRGELGDERPRVVCLLHGVAAGVFPASEAGICGRLGPSVSPFPNAP